jgi:caffeoyl-CoA O-methyltransferase
LFHAITPAILERMRFLEARDAEDRADGTARLERLRQVPPDTGRLLALLAAGAPPGALLEVGTSAGYSTLWLSLAARQAGRRITTFEVLPAKAQLARETFELAGVRDVVEFVLDDARRHIGQYEEIGFCFLDAEKEVYGDVYELVVPRLARGGLLVADNAVNHRPVLEAMLQRALSDDRVDAMIVPMDNGLLLCRKV